jgi:hypothetical protein
MTSTESPAISIVVPVSTVRGALPDLLWRLSRNLRRCASSFEVIFIDNGTGSSASSRYLAARSATTPWLKLVKSRASTSGSLLLTGLRQAQGRIIGVVDASLMFPPEAIPAMVNQLRTADVVVANQESGVLDRTSSYVKGLITGGAVPSGIKLMHRHILSLMPNTKQIRDFDRILLNQAHQAGAKVVEYTLPLGSKLRINNVTASFFRNAEGDQEARRRPAQRSTPYFLPKPSESSYPAARTLAVGGLAGIGLFICATPFLFGVTQLNGIVAVAFLLALTTILLWPAEPAPALTLPKSHQVKPASPGYSSLRTATLE